MDGVSLDFSKFLDAVSQHTGETGCTVCWVKKTGWVIRPREGGVCHIQLVAGHQLCSPGLSVVVAKLVVSHPVAGGIF